MNHLIGQSADLDTHPAVNNVVDDQWQGADQTDARFSDHDERIRERLKVLAFSRPLPVDEQKTSWSSYLLMRCTNGFETVGMRHTHV